MLGIAYSAEEYWKGMETDMYSWIYMKRSA